MIPHTNSVMEPEFNRLAPNGVSVHATRVKLPDLTRQGFLALRETACDAARLIADMNVEAVAFACTAGTFVGGEDYDRELVGEIEEIVGCPVVSAASSVVNGLRRLKARRISVVTPYKPEVNEQLKLFLAAQGFEVVGFAFEDVGVVAPAPPYSSRKIGYPGLQQPEVWYRLARQAFEPGVDAVFISAAGIRALESAERLETDLGVPVVTSSQALIWEALRRAHIGTKIKGYGRLLRLPLNEEAR
jgi:maleate isomerase